MLRSLEGTAATVPEESSAPPEALLPERRSCRICLEQGEKGTELLDSCCACRGSVRFICTECLLLQWEARPDKGLQCGVCRQAFSGRAAALLTERLQKHVEQQQDIQTGPSVDLLKQQVTTATGLWQQGKLQEAANLFRETIPGLKMTDAKGQLYSAQHNLSLVMVAMGRPEEARAELRIARRGLATLYGAQHPLALKAAHNEADRKSVV